MAKTDIEYGDRTWNPLTGCTKVSEGCKHCWAETMAKRLKAMGRAEYQDAVDEKGNWTGKITLVPERLKEPLTWRKPQHVLVEYMGDLFNEKVDPLYIGRVFNVVGSTPQHTYQFLTKRPDRMNELLSIYGDIALHGKTLPNVILGCTIENQKRADERLPAMRALSAAGWRTWVSYEPALGNVDWKGWEFLNQLVAGGESGPGARPMHPDWAQGALDFCLANDVPFFFKQWGTWKPVHGVFMVEGRISKFEEHKWDNHTISLKMGKKLAGRILCGREWSEMPSPAPSALSGTSPILGERQNGGGSEEVRDEA